MSAPVQVIEASPSKFRTEIDRVMQRLIEAETPVELTQIADAAEVLRVMAQRARLGLAAQNRCACIRCRAERRIGQILDEIDRQGVGRPPKGIHEPHKPTLPELGIGKNLAKRARRLAAIPQWEFDGLLRRATDTGWEITTRWLYTTAEARQRRQRNLEPQAGGRVEDLHEFITAHPGGMGTIYMDIPWEIEGVLLPYPTMTLDEIKALPIPDLANRERCHLHVWTLPGHIQSLAYEVTRHWGFRVVSEFSWRKGHRLGNGDYYRMCHENCLVAVWADRDDRFDDHSLPSCEEFPRGQHSEKPDEVRRRIELASPPPRIELFARREVPGWFSWGYEIPTPLTEQR
jgi:N6-adenosine-specific RNA methylase IME4